MEGAAAYAWFIRLCRFAGEGRLITLRDHASAEPGRSAGPDKAFVAVQHGGLRFVRHELRLIDATRISLHIGYAAAGYSLE